MNRLHSAFGRPANRRRLILALVSVPLLGVALFVATLAHGSGNDSPHYVSDTSSVQVTATPPAH